jgi:quercetin dioxygenase-like cupin family protein/DNA-binding XRE family transcriptional regulator
MKEKKGPRGTSAMDDPLGHVGRFAMRDEEMAFMESIGPEHPDRDQPISVGERVKEVREKKGLSLQDVSQRTDIDIQRLRQIEAGDVAPPLGTVIKLAKALEMRMGYFISGRGQRAYTIVRGPDRKIVSRYDTTRAKYYGYQYESLAPNKRDRHMDPFMVSLEPSKTEEERSTHAGQEFIYVLEGDMEVRLEKEVHILKPGDSIYYDSTVPHLVKAYGDKPTRILAVLYTER